MIMQTATRSPSVSASLIQPGWPTPVFWLLIIASIAIAVYAWRTIPAQRTGRNLIGWAAVFSSARYGGSRAYGNRLLITPHHPGSPFGTTGLAISDGIDGEHAANTPFRILFR